MIKNKRFQWALVLMFGLICFTADILEAKNCDNRKEMIEMVDLYLDRLVKNDPKGLPVSKRVKITENGYPIELGQGLFRTAKEVLFKQYIIDPSNGQAAVYSVVLEDVLPANVMIRLKVKKQVIAEIETIVARNGEASIAAPENLTTPKPVYDEILLDTQRLPRSEMILVADSYFEGIEQNTGDSVPFHADCNRTENGAQTTNSPPTFSMGCKEQFDNKVFAYITEVRNRRFLVADEERGLVWGIFVFDIPGKKEHFETFPIPIDDLPTSMFKPRSIFVSELFKIVNGQILEIEAVMVNVPFGATSGWEAKDTCRN